jgi:hypothetical protein
MPMAMLLGSRTTSKLSLRINAQMRRSFLGDRSRWAHWLNLGVREQATTQVAAAPGRTHDPHAPGFGHRIDHVGFFQQPGLQPACGSSRRRIGDEGALTSRAGDFRRSALRKHVAGMQDDDVAASFRLVEIGRAQQHREAFILDEMMNDVPELTPR